MTTSLDSVVLIIAVASMLMLLVIGIGTSVILARLSFITDILKAIEENTRPK